MSSLPLIFCHIYHILSYISFSGLRDNVPAIKLGSWPVNAHLFNGEAAAGPCPVLFSSNIEAASEAISLNPGRAHTDVMRINRVFLSLESIPMKEALNVIKKPR